MGHNTSGGQLKQFIEAIEHLEGEKKQIAEEIKLKYAEAKGVGFDTKIMRMVIRLRKMTQPERQEESQLLAIYKAALGMLDGDPLPPSALKRLEGEDDEDASAAPTGPARNPVPKPTGQPSDPHAPLPERAPPDTVDVARAKGAQAALDGLKVTQNPYPPFTPQRAAWEEGHCQATGSDGMEVPKAWQRTEKKDDASPPPGGNGAAGGGGANGAEPHPPH